MYIIVEILKVGNVNDAKVAIGVMCKVDANSVIAMTLADLAMFVIRLRANVHVSDDTVDINVMNVR